MGLMDILSNAFGDQSSNAQAFWEGLVKNTQLQQIAEEAAKRPKPGKYCGKYCRISGDGCQACLEIQARFEHSLHQLEKLEEVSDYTSDQIQQLSLEKKVTKCTLCGAPFEKNANECPYCGTAYPKGALDFDIPLSKLERNELLMKKAQETYDIFVESADLAIEYSKTLPTTGALGAKLLELSQSMSGMSAHDLMVQDVKELMQGAKHYNVSLSQYIHGIALAEMLTPRNLEYQESTRITNERIKERNEAFAAQHAQRAQQSRFTAMDYMQRRAETISYDYGGGAGSSSGGRSCGNCSYYYGGNKCARNDTRTNASKSCAWFTWK